MNAENGTDPLADLKADLATIGGGTSMVPTTASAQPARHLPTGHPSGSAQTRATLASLRTDAGMAVLAACGVPPAFASDRAESNTLREAWRLFVVSSVAPVAALVAEELTRKLDTPVAFDLEGLRANDAMSVARAIGSRATALDRLITPGPRLRARRRRWAWTSFRTGPNHDVRTRSHGRKHLCLAQRRSYGLPEPRASRRKPTHNMWLGT